MCVPVRDEARRLPALIEALGGQTEGFTLCLLFDGCRDGSEAVAAACARPFPLRTAQLARAEPNAGRARAAAVALGLEAGAVVLLTTDADSRPAADWVAANLRALAQADVVAGRVTRARDVSPVQDRLEVYLDRLFRLRRILDPVPWEAANTHHCASGASLGFRADAYRAAGGFEKVAAGEDGRMVDAAHRAGLRVRRDAAVTVETSARRHGRAQGGLADHLRALDRCGALPTVAHPADAAWRWRMQARARVAFGSDLSALSAWLERTVHEVEAVAAACPNAEAFATHVVPDVPGGERLVTLDVAEGALAVLEDARVAAAA